MSILRKLDTVFPRMRRRTSPIPIGLTPGFLSSGMSLHASNELIDLGSTYSVHNLLHMRATASHASIEHLPNDFEQRIRLQVSESSPLGPAEPRVSLAARSTALASMFSKITGSTLRVDP